MATVLLVVFLVLYAAEYAFETMLVLLDRRQGGEPDFPPELEAAVDREKYEKAEAYAAARDRLGLVTSAVSTPLFLVLLFAGAFEALDGLVRSWDLGPVVTGAVFLTLLSLAGRLLGLPARAYAVFVIEERFGFNRTTPRLFAADQAKKMAISAVMGFGLLCLVLLFLEKGGSLRWLWATGGVLAVQMLMVFVYPLLIMPLFNTFRPLEDEELAGGIEDLARRAGFPLKDVRVMDGSRRTRHSNAFFIGLFGMRRVVLYDTLVEKSTPEEILAVLAHEMGHWKLGHVRQRLWLLVPLTAATLFALHHVLGWPAFFEAFGISRPSPWTGLLFLGVFSGTLLYWLSPLYGWWSRRCEYAADRFALQHGPGAGPMKSSLLRLALDNLSDLTPHPLRVAFHYSHPPLAERLRALDRADEEPASAGA